MAEAAKRPRTASRLEAAYVACWNARHAAEDRSECMSFCAEAINHADHLFASEQCFIRSKIGEAQRHWGLQ